MDRINRKYTQKKQNRMGKTKKHNIRKTRTEIKQSKQNTRKK